MHNFPPVEKVQGEEDQRMNDPRSEEGHRRVGGEQRPEFSSEFQRTLKRPDGEALPLCLFKSLAWRGKEVWLEPLPQTQEGSQGHPLHTVQVSAV
jgi:hypothetical protein